MSDNTVTLTLTGDPEPLKQALNEGADAGDSARSRFEDLGAGLGLALGAGLAAAATVAITGYLERGEIGSTLAAQLGDYGDAERYGQLAGQVYARGVAGSMEEAGAAIKGVLQNGLVDSGATDAEIKKVAASVVNLGKITGEEADKITGSLSNMVKTGMAKSTAEAMDLITAAQQNGINKAGDLFDTVNEYGTQFRKLGLEGSESLGLINQAMKNGARDSDVAADALKEFSIRAIDGSKTTAEGFKMIGLDAEDMAAKIAKGGPAAAAGLDQTLDRLRAIEDPVKRSQAAVALFGTQAEDLGDALYSMDLDTATQSLGNFKGAADKAGKALEESGSAKLERFKRGVQMALVDALAAAIPYIEATFGWLKDNSAWVEPLAMGLAVFAGVIGTVAAAMKVWAIVQAILNASLWGSPLTWIVLGIALIIAIIVVIATKTTWFQDLWNGAWGAIKGAAKAVWDWLKSNWPLLLAILTGPIGLAVYAIVKNWDKIKNAAGAAWDWIKDKFDGAKDMLLQAGKDLVQGLINGINKMKDKAINLAKGIGDSIKSGFKKIVGIGSPSKVFDQYGRWTVEGLVRGMDHEAPSAEATMAGISNSVVASAPTVNGSAGGASASVTVSSGGSRLDDLLVEVLQAAIGRKGGNVQTVLGGKR